jgi:hypothetical protein
MLTDSKHYNHLANQQTAAKLAEYNAWIRTHTPAQIYAANLARTQLRKMLIRGTPRYTTKLKDDRQAKRPSGTYTIFVTERWGSGDLKGIATADASKIIAQEWKALSASEKKVCALFNFSALTYSHLCRNTEINTK